MPSGKHHQAISRERTGKTYAELHRWIDENKDDTSVNHRSKNHHYTTELRKFVEDKWGHEGVSEWLFHIALDNLHTSLKNDRIHNISDSNLFSFGFKKNGFIYCDEDKLSEDELDEEFDEEY